MSRYVEQATTTASVERRTLIEFEGIIKNYLAPLLIDLYSKYQFEDADQLMALLNNYGFVNIREASNNNNNNYRMMNSVSIKEFKKLADSMIHLSSNSSLDNYKNNSMLNSLRAIVNSRNSYNNAITQLDEDIKNGEVSVRKKSIMHRTLRRERDRLRSIIRLRESSVSTKN